MLASYHGHAPLVSLLVNHGADPNRLNDRGQSPLAGVVFKNERDVIKILLEAGADPEVGEPTALEATRVRRRPMTEVSQLTARRSSSRKSLKVCSGSRSKS